MKEIILPLTFFANVRGVLTCLGVLFELTSRKGEDKAMECVLGRNSAVKRQWRLLLNQGITSN